MKRLLMLTALVSVVSCQNSKTVSVYEASSGGQILTTDGKRSYFGPSSVPNEDRLLQDYGAPISDASSEEVRCLIVSDLTFAISEQQTFSCNGLTFRVVTSDGNASIVRATCEAFRNGKCESDTAAVPVLEYEYAYIPGKGIEWIRFFDEQSSLAGDVLKHRSGPRVLH